MLEFVEQDRTNSSVALVLFVLALSLRLIPSYSTAPVMEPSFQLPSNFPVFPRRSNLQPPWSPNLEAGWSILDGAYRRAQTILRQEADPIRLKYHVETLVTDMLPILEAMEADQVQENLPMEWLHSAAQAISLMVIHLQVAIDGADGMYVSVHSKPFTWLTSYLVIGLRFHILILLQ